MALQFENLLKRTCFYLLLLSQFPFHSTVATLQPHQCTYMEKVTTENCGSRKTELTTYEIAERNRIRNISSDVLYNNSKEGCMNDIPHIPCRRLINFARVWKASFGYKIQVQIGRILLHCCGNCTRYHVSSIRVPLHDANRSTLEKYDVIYPVHGQPFTTRLYGFYFVPVFNIQNAYYFTLKRENEEMLMQIINVCWDVWPLLTGCLILAFIAGFLCWIADTWSNEEEFPRPFISGLHEGFWWSFVTMTTVGYGDKVPKSIMGRIVAVVWIIVGLTISSIYVAYITSGVMSVQTHHDDQVSGKNVGVLKGRLHDAVLVSQLGGLMHEVEFNESVIGVFQLIKKLERKEIDGFLVNWLTYHYYNRKIVEEDKYKPYGEEVRHVGMVWREKSFTKEPLVTGALVKHHHDYIYFKKYLENNWLQIQGCYSYDVNYKRNKMTPSFIHIPWAAFFKTFFYVIIGVLGAISCFGLSYEYRRRKIREDS